MSQTYESLIYMRKIFRRAQGIDLDLNLRIRRKRFFSDLMAAHTA